MIRKLAALAIAVAVLSGCVLQSRAPLYADKDAELVLGAKGGIAKMASWREGKWVEDDDERVEIAVVGQHYVAKGKSDVSLYFVKLKGNWFVVQGMEAGSPAVYMLAEVENRVAEGRFLTCKDLKANAEVSAQVEHEGEDCFVRHDADAKKLFTSLLKNAGEASFRLEILH